MLPTRSCIEHGRRRRASQLSIPNELATLHYHELATLHYHDLSSIDKEHQLFLIFVRVCDMLYIVHVLCLRSMRVPHCPIHQGANEQAPPSATFKFMNSNEHYYYSINKWSSMATYCSSRTVTLSHMFSAMCCPFIMHMCAVLRRYVLLPLNSRSVHGLGAASPSSPCNAALHVCNAYNCARQDSRSNLVMVFLQCLT